VSSRHVEKSVKGGRRRRPGLEKIIDFFFVDILNKRLNTTTLPPSLLQQI